MQTSSFTSRSSAGTFVVLMLAAVLSAAFSWHAKRHWQVESAFFSESIRVSQRYANTLRAKSPHLFIVFGGSTSKASWIPSILQDEFGVPIVNFGLHAGFGPHVITELAMREARPGDTVVIAFEPASLARDTIFFPTSGTDFFLHEKGLSFRRGQFFRLAPTHLVQYLQGNTRYNLFMIMKRLRRMKPYRYVIDDNLRKDGWLEVNERRHLPFDPTARPSRPIHLGKAGRELILAIRDECERRGVRAIYAIPPSLEGNPNATSAYAGFLLDILQILPVVRDPLLGCNPNPNEFADTTQHPLRSGAIRATRSLGTALATDQFWTKEELSRLHARRIDADALSISLPRKIESIPNK